MAQADKLKVMLRIGNDPGQVIYLTRVPAKGERIKTQLGECEVVQVTHTPYGNYDAEVEGQ